MKSKEYGARPPRNVFVGGRLYSLDEYNRALKGDAFNKAYKNDRSPYAEYSSLNWSEYHQYPEQKDLTAEENDQQKSAEKKRREQQKAKNAKIRRVRMLQQVICLAAGSLIIVSAYNASVTQRNIQPADPQPIVDPATEDEPAVAYTALWEWNSDLTAVTCAISDPAGEIVGEIPAQITTAEIPAGCSTDGKLSYTATAQYDGQSFTDSRDEILPALGHSFDEGKEVVTDDGQPAIDFECTRCHEHFVIKNTAIEE